MSLWLALAISCGKKAAGPSYEVEKSYTKGQVELRVLVSKRSITVAEHLTLALEATAGKATEVELPRFGEKLEQFGISDYASPPPELLQGDRARTRRTYTLEPFLSGDYKIPPMTVRFRDRGAGEWHEIQTDEIAVQVKSLLPSQIQKLEIKDIAAPQGIAFRLGWKAALAVSALALVLAAAVLLWWLRRKRAREEEARRLLAHEIAYAELERLLALGLVEKGEVKAFYNGISGVLRHYIENRFGLMAPERTTEEFLVEMERSDALEASWKAILSRFLEHCDLVKFAEHQPSNEEIQRTFDTCKDFIEATREKEESNK